MTRPAPISRRLLTLSLLVAALVYGAPAPATEPPTAEPGPGGQPASEQAEANTEASEYVSAIDLFPASTAGLVRVPDFPAFCTAWHQTGWGQLIQDPAVAPFRDAQRAQARSYLNPIDSKLGLTPQDLYDIASGEVVLGWLPFQNDARRPYSLCIVADVRGRLAEAEQALEKIDEDLKAEGATRKDQQHLGQSIRVYARKPKPGQLMIEQIAITVDRTRMIVADRDKVINDLLDAIHAQPVDSTIGSSESYQAVQARSMAAIAQHMPAEQGTVGIQWFARPFTMGRILRELFAVDRGNQVDIIKLLENQGFDAVEAAGGVLVVGIDEFDFLHRGVILAPPTTDQPSRYELGARMLQFPNTALADVPSWIGQNIASYSRWNWKIEEAFWAAETIVNEALGDEVFRPSLDGVRDDEEGPQLDVENDVLPSLDDQLILITDSMEPATIDSERMLVAIRIKNADVIRASVRKAMEVEPDVTKVETVAGTEIWVVDRSNAVSDFDDDDIFADLGLDEDVAKDATPLLDQWALALVDQGPGSRAPYLMFSSHPDLLIDAAQRIVSGEAEGLGSVPEVEQVLAAMKKLGAKEVAYDHVSLPTETFKIKYELLRQGRLKELDSVGAAVLRRLFRDDKAAATGEPAAAKLPPIEQIEHYFGAGGRFIETTADGWTINAFILK